MSVSYLKDHKDYKPSGYYSEEPSTAAGSTSRTISSLPAVEKQIQNPATPHGLYEVGLLDNTIISVVENLNEAIKNLDIAIKNYNDEIEREIRLDLLMSNLFALNSLKGISQNFGDIITAIQVSLKNKNTSPFKESELSTLKKVLEIMKNNFNMSLTIYDQCLSLLEESFDLLIPMNVAFNNAE